jgi:hypothetical protein
MSSTNFKTSCSYCSGNHTKVSKCAQYSQDRIIAQYVSCIDLTCKRQQNVLHGISKNILRVAVNIVESGKTCKGANDILMPRIQRSKPLCKFTKCQLIRRLVQLSTDFAEQVDTIIARKERQEDAERQQEAEQNDCCPICLDPLENQAQCTSPCGHTFCSPCFVKNISMELSRGHTARCAYCRTTTIELTYQGSN